MSRVLVYLLLSAPLVGAFAMFSLGIVVIHQASRVLNLAHGAMAMLPAFVAYAAAEAGAPVPVALAAGVASGAITGVMVERVFVRTLRRQGTTAQTVGTVAALGLLLGVAIKVWGTTPRSGLGVFAEGGFRVGASLLRWGEIGLFAVAALATVAFFVVFRFTDLGLAMRGAADNRRAAALMGLSPDRTTTAAWAIGGTLAAVAGMLLAPVTTLHPINLSLLALPAFVAALIGGLGSTAGALAGAAIVGVVQGMVPALGLVPGLGGFATQVGAPQLVLTVLALLVMMLRGQRFAAAESRTELAPAARRSRPRMRRSIAVPATARRVLAVAGLGIAVAWPLFAPFSLVGNAVQACILALIAASLVLLTGWVGQISLAQAAFVGIGALVSAQLAGRAGIQFPLNLPLAAAVSAAVAAMLGVVALRVRGLYLAVATLIFLWMATEWAFRASWLAGAGGGASVRTDPIGRAGGIPHFDFTQRRTFYYVALAAAAATMWALANLRDSKTGRAFFAVRGSETAAASLGIDVTRTKLIAFAISGTLAGVAGNLLVTGQGSVSTSQFGVGTSLLYLAIAVVGGLRSLGGAVAASLLFAGVAEAFFRFRFLAGWQDLVNAGLLAGVLLVYPGGLAAIPGSLGLRPARRRRASQPASAASLATAVETTQPAVLPDPAPMDRAQRRIVLAAEEITVRFGGLTAVDGASIEVREGEIVGLIGPNGAGKTTLFNAISGLNDPAGGRLTLLGRDATRLAVHQRAALGLARTFQVIQLASELSVFQNLLVATHGRNPTGALAHLAVTRPSLEAELAARQRVRSVIERLRLHDVADRPVAGLPFGTLRMVELARALVTGAPLVMLDEPASGLDNNETDRLREILLEIRRDLGVSILLIEHDVRMVTAVSDYMYVLEFGRLVAEGSPAEVTRDAAVVAAYLGTAP